METTIYSEDSRQRIQNRIASAVKTKLIGNGIENADELSIKFTEMMAKGHSKEEVLSELEKYSKVDENKTLEQIEKHNKSFVDWLFGYSSVVVPLNSAKKENLPTSDNDTPLTEADTETTNENQLVNQSTSVSALPIDDIGEEEEEEEEENDDDDDEKEKNELSSDDEEAIEQEENHEIKNELLAEVLANDNNDDNEEFEVAEDNIEEEEESSDDSDDIPELQSRDSDIEQIEDKVLETEPQTEETKIKIEVTEVTEDKKEEETEVKKEEDKKDEEEKVKEDKNEEEKEKEVEEKKPEVPKRRSFIRIKEGKSGRFTPIKSEDRHSFVKRNLTHVATQLDEANKVQKKMMSHAVAVANASENLTLSKKKSSISLNSNGVEKKKSFRRDSINSNSSSVPSVYSSTNATFINSFANKTFPKVNKTSVNGTSVTPENAVRCSYWPNCNRGEECKFWHPKEICPNLNNCPDGDQCLYIHPVIPQNQLNKNKNKKKSENNIEVIEKHTLQKKLSKRDSMLSLNGSSSQSNLKKSLKNAKEVNNTTTNAVAANTYAIECKYGANCTRPDCKFSHPSPAAILAAKKKAESVAILKKKESGRLKEKKSHDVLKHKESKNSNKLSTSASQIGESKKNAITEETQTILCRYGSECKRTGCKFKHTTTKK